jgi:hypothetical protein
MLGQGFILKENLLKRRFAEALVKLDFLGLRKKLAADKKEKIYRRIKPVTTDYTVQELNGREPILLCAVCRKRAL